MYWILQDNMFQEEGFHRLVDVLERFGLPYSIHKVLPFGGGIVPDPVPTEERVIVMGSYTMARIARERGWTPGSFDNANLDYTIQRGHWGARMLNGDSIVTRFDEVPEQIKPFFIRPVLDSKSFNGQVKDWPSFVEWRDRVLTHGADNGGTLCGETMVMTSRVKAIHREYRLWILDGKVITSSLYKMGGRALFGIGSHMVHAPQMDDNVISYAEETAQLWSPCRAYVMDIADTPEGLRVIEVGCMNAAGFYGADMGKLVEKLEYTNWM